ncbi:MAG: hypothetical protein V4636_20115 [Pseudomonadota bacterium]
MNTHAISPLQKWIATVAGGVAVLAVVGLWTQAGRIAKLEEAVEACILASEQNDRMSAQRSAMLREEFLRDSSHLAREIDAMRQDFRDFKAKR